MNEEQLFLVSMQRLMDDLDNIDDMETNISSLQSEIDSELSDYYHLIEFYGDKLSVNSKVIIVDKIKELREIRRCRNNNFELVKCFKDNCRQLNRKDNRAMLRNTIGNKVKQLHNDYNFRVLTKEYIDSLLNDDNKKEEKTNKKRKYNRNCSITKEQLQECLENDMKTIDMARTYGVDQSYISHLKKKYGLAVRHYTKRS